MRFDEGAESAEVATSGEICLQCESEVAIEKKTNKEIRCLQCEPEVTIGGIKIISLSNIRPIIIYFH
jgi:hypothetical protein